MMTMGGPERPLLLLLMSCTDPPVYELGEVPVGGAPNEAAADAVEAELAAMASWFGPHRVLLESIDFVDVAAPIGRYTHEHRSIELSGLLQPTDLRIVLRHELCHALDRQEGLADQAVQPWQDLAVQVSQEYVGDRQRRSEALAQQCELGPIGAAAIAAVPCPTDADLEGASVDWLLAHVWGGYAPPSPIESDEAPFVEVPVATSTPFDYVRVASSATSSAILVNAVRYTEDGTNVVVFAADVNTGTPVPLELLADDVGEVQPFIEDPLVGLLADSATVNGEVLGLYIVESRLWEATTPSAGRLLLSLSGQDGDWKSVLHKCVDRSQGEGEVFPADGHLWQAWVDTADSAPMVYWARIR
jgi:hypothetical protein